MDIGKFDMGPSNYFIYREQTKGFQDVGLYKPGQVSVTGLGAPEQVVSLSVTDGLLPLLGVTPPAGRLFTRADDSPTGPQTVLVSHAYWLTKFGGAPSLVSRSIRIDGVARQVIGILPRDCRFLDLPDPAVVLPLRLNRADTYLGQFSYRGLARLKPGVTLA